MKTPARTSNPPTVNNMLMFTTSPMEPRSPVPTKVSMAVKYPPMAKKEAQGTPWLQQRLRLLTTALRPKLAVIEEVDGRCKDGQDAEGEQDGPEVGDEVAGRGVGHEEGGMVMNNSNMLADLMEPDQMGCFAVIGMT